MFGGRKIAALVSLVKPPVYRERLKDAFTAHDLAQDAVTKALEVVTRMELIVAEGRAAARRAAEADAARRAALARWAETGCDPASAVENEQLARTVDELKRLADRADHDATAAFEGLAHAREIVAKAKRDLAETDGEIRNSIGLILAAEASSDTRELEKLAEQYRAKRLSVVALYRILSRDERWRSNDAASLLQGPLARAAIEPVPEIVNLRTGEILPGAAVAAVFDAITSWERRAKALHENAE
jgi:hypothetical protein